MSKYTKFCGWGVNQLTLGGLRSKKAGEELCAVYLDEWKVIAVNVQDMRSCSALQVADGDRDPLGGLRQDRLG